MCVSFYMAMGVEMVGAPSSACVKVLYLHLASKKKVARKAEDGHR